MFSFKVPNEIVAYSFKLASVKNYGLRSEANGSFEEQVRGLIGQNHVLRQFGLPAMNLEDGFDGGIDLSVCGMKLDVKTMGRSVDPKPDYVNNFFSAQKKFSPDGYLFCSLNVKTWVITYCGWADIDTFNCKATLYKAGEERVRDDGTKLTLKADIYEIKNSDLIQSGSFQEMFSQMLGKVAA